MAQRTVTPPTDADPDVRLAWILEDVTTKVRRRQTKFSRWKTAGFWITGLASVLTAAAGVSVMNEWLPRNAAGALAVTAAILTALAVAFDPAAHTVRVPKNGPSGRDYQGKSKTWPERTRCPEPRASRWIPVSGES